MTSKSLAKKIAALSLTKKALDVVVMDLRTLTTMTDFFVVCNGESDTQARAIADAIREGTWQEGEDAWKHEGYQQGNWIVLDYVDVVVHVFHKDARAFYNLEKLWGDAKFEHVSDEEPEKKEKIKTTKPRVTKPRIAKKKKDA